jgi:uncharacterized protein
MELKKHLTICGHYIDDYLRCPYRLKYSVEHGLKTFDLLKPGYNKIVLIPQGNSFERLVFSKFKWRKSKEKVEDLMKKNVVIQKPLIQVFNDWYQVNLIGQPDFIVPYRGVYIPVDIKSHKGVNKEDALRITFYSKLIRDKFYQDKEIIPGFILDKTKKLIKIDTKKYEKELHSLIGSIHSCFEFRDYVQPIMCRECSNCKLYEECIKVLEKKQGLSLIYQIGPKNQKRLEDIGIRTIKQLSKISLNKLIEQTRLFSFFPNTEEIAVNHARSIISKKTIVFGKETLPKKEIEIYIDLEYDTLPFCYGVLINNTKTKKMELFQFFEDEKGFDEFISNLLQKNIENSVVYSFAGISADFPKLKNKPYFLELNNQHIDLFRFISENVAIPLYHYSQKSISPFFNIKEYEDTKIKDGWGCLLEYNHYKDIEKQLKIKEMEINPFKNVSKNAFEDEENGNLEEKRCILCNKKIYRGKVSYDTYKRKKYCSAKCLKKSVIIILKELKKEFNVNRITHLRIDEKVANFIVHKYLSLRTPKLDITKGNLNYIYREINAVYAELHSEEELDRKDLKLSKKLGSLDLDFLYIVIELLETASERGEGILTKTKKEIEEEKINFLNKKVELRKQKETIKREILKYNGADLYCLLKLKEKIVKLIN